jgi:SAM-dependent methyltransferase
VATEEAWASGDAYELYIGRWSRLVAQGFLRWLEPDRSASWMDVGCGTGALTKAILNEAAPATVRGEDPSRAHVAHVQEHLNDARVEIALGDAQTIATPDATFDYVVSGLVLNFVPDPVDALAEMKRVTRVGGMVAGYVWDYASGMEMIRYFWDAASELDARARELDEEVRSTLFTPRGLSALWKGAGLRDVEVVPLVVPTVFQDFDDYWQPFLGGQGPAPRYNMSLSEEARSRLRELLRERLPTQSDSSIRLRARAWAARGLARGTGPRPDDPARWA